MGLMERAGRLGSEGEWEIIDRDQLLAHIYERAGSPDIDRLKQKYADGSRELEEHTSTILSIIAANRLPDIDGYCSQLCEGISGMKPFSAAEVIKCMSPSGQQTSRDVNAINAGLWTPAHMEAYAVALSLLSPFEKEQELCIQVKRLAQHLENKHKASIESRGIGINIFIGHGRSQQWRELKDFITERFRLPVDEFNRVPVAGITNIQRLQQMLDQAEFAFLVMTAEDETSEGRLRARQNVIHEVGLIQGRLRFTKAIVLLEEECEDFPTSLALANYDTNEESAAFEQIREVLEREGVLEK
jgi:predicted nucleotide-binding protein